MADIDIQSVLDKSTCVYDLTKIELALDAMAQKITAQLENKNPLLLCVMIGALVPTGHLVTRLNFPLEIDYIHATRYRGTTNGGELNWLIKPRQSLKDRTILIVDDIMDGGLTIQAIINYCEEAGAKEVFTAVMINKERTREPGVAFEPDFSGLSVPNKYVFGFGLDYKEYLRNAPGIYVVADEHQ